MPPAGQVLPASWRSGLIRLAAAWLALGIATWRDWAAMLDQWWNISTYNHILFVPLIAGWLIHLRRRELLEIAPAPWWPGLAPLAATMLVWLIGSVAGVNIVSQAGAVASLIVIVPAILGPRVALACAFPLAYLLFLVPFGDEMVPTLQMVTADIVIWLTHLSGIEAVIDGVFIDTPVGLFEVAEACSGVKFLVAMIALGVLVCYACFRGWKRRAIFMATATGLPILANGVRAWGTIFIAQSQGIEFAVGFDHIFYGWVFFAIVVFLLLAAFWRWFDREPDELGIDFPDYVRSGRLARLVGTGARPQAHLASVVALLAVVFGWNVSAASVEAAIPAQVELPQVDGWQRVDAVSQVAWRPRFAGADHTLFGRYRDASGREVDVAYAFYAAQSEGREAGAAGEGALVPETPWRWVAPWMSDTEGTGEQLMAYGNLRRHAVTSYRTGDTLTGSAARLKLHSMQGRLTLAGEPTMTLILSVEGADSRTAEETIADFTAATGNRGEWMDRIAGLR
jgi:exosortase A